MALVGLGELRDVNITACPFVSIEFVSFSENSAREPGLGERVLRLHEACQLDQSRLLRGILHSVRPRCFQLIVVRFIFNPFILFLDGLTLVLNVTLTLTDKRTSRISGNAIVRYEQQHHDFHDVAWLF